MEEETIRLLVVDDDESFLDDLTALLAGRFQVERAANGAEALAAFRSRSFDAVLLDIELGQGMDGFEVLERLRADDPELPVIMVTRDATAASAVSALKKGAIDYIDKRPDLADLERRISRALEEQRLWRENRALRREIEVLRGRMVGESEPMKTLHEEIALASEGTSPVLIIGETGTGKELVARRIHDLSAPKGPFVALNCAAVPRDLFEARLFGSERGAYTGADKMVPGVFELARTGVLFLDEITEIDSSLQAKLLRVIEERRFERLGSHRTIGFKGKIVASTNRDVREAVEDGSLRKDLYYRFSTFVIALPPLRDRRGDIPVLAEYFLARKSAELKKRRPELTQEIRERLCGYDWPGNVRELENAIEAFVVRGRLHLPGLLATPDAATGDADISGQSYQEAKRTAMHRFQRDYIGAILAACDGDVAEAARRMGLSRFGLQKILKELGLPESPA
ncbi:MAG: sigma-54-dependent Fis family transcriptional regulator [bacterium]|nr:MAG: sigma-54-dependent Fis family transcriptional regulator [bacterium]